MAKTTGQAASFANKQIYQEEVATGNGSDLVFPFESAKVPIFIYPVTINYEIDGVAYGGFTDENGNFSGTYINSGSIAQDGTGTITFSLAPDGPITLEYRVRGLLQHLLDYYCGTKYTESPESGNGAQISFSGTLTNGPLAKGQVRVSFTIATQTYYVWSNGDGEWVHEKIAGSSLDHTSKDWALTFAEAPDDGTPITFTYCVPQNGEDGRDWMILRQENTKIADGSSDAFTGLLLQEVVLRNSGKSYEDTVIIGIREYQYVTENLYGWDLNVYYEFADGVIWNANSIYHGLTTYDGGRNTFTQHPSTPFYDGDIPYWFYGDKNLIRGAAQVAGTIYESFYLGRGIPFAPPSDYPHPLIAIGTAYGTTGYTSEHSSHSFIIKPYTGGYGALVIGVNDQYLKVINSGLKFTPTNDYIDSGELDIDETGAVNPLAIYVVDLGNSYTLFELDGVYVAPGALVTNGTVTIGADTYRIFQNIFRVGDVEYMCMKEE